MRLSRGRSTPTRRAIRWLSLRFVTVVWSCRILRLGEQAPAIRSGGGHPGCCRASDHVAGCSVVKRSAQPCRCLWRGFSQITMTRPWRRITLHLSQIFLTLGLTFTTGGPLRFCCRLFVAVGDPTRGEVVGRELHHHAVLGEDPDVVLAHLAAD